ncbi:MAG: hypothetical protein R3C05_04390 [Pirellulaceae bacterium]
MTTESVSRHSQWQMLAFARMGSRAGNLARDLTGSATKADYITALRSITYNNTAENLRRLYRVVHCSMATRTEHGDSRYRFHGSE